MRETLNRVLFGTYDPPNPLGLKPGQSVKLRSGGPEMTVIGLNISGQISCHWFDGKALCSGRFAASSLKKSD